MRYLKIIRVASLTATFFIGILLQVIDGSSLLSNLFITSSILGYYLFDSFINRKEFRPLNKVLLTIGIVISLVLIFAIYNDERTIYPLWYFPLLSLGASVLYFLYKKSSTN